MRRCCSRRAADQSAVISAGGFPYYRPLPEVDWINFITRMKTPLLMLGGRLDDYYPLESSQLPYFQRAGAPEKDKKLVLYDVAHTARPAARVIRETLDWLDKYLGPVKRYGRRAVP